MDEDPIDFRQVAKKMHGMDDETYDRLDKQVSDFVAKCRTVAESIYDRAELEQAMIGKPMSATSPAAREASISLAAGTLVHLPAHAIELVGTASAEMVIALIAVMADAIEAGKRL